MHRSPPWSWRCGSWLCFRGWARADEAAVRRAAKALLDDWNRHDVKAWTAHLAEDAWYTETNDSVYQRNKGREQAVSRFSYSIEHSDLEWEIVRMKTRPDGVVSVAMIQRVSNLPKTDGKYKSVFTSNPSMARWRRDADGRWRVVFFTAHEGWAAAEIKKDEEGAPAVAAAPAPSPLGSAAPPRGTEGSEPKEYTAFWGRMAHGCNYCHGRPPALPSSEITSRIVSVGAATADGAGLRAAMKRKELGPVMEFVLDDPALDDAALDAVRRYLVDVRDGGMPNQLVFDAPGATRELPLRNERSSRDTPATIALLRVSGPFAIDATLSTCRSGGQIAGSRPASWCSCPPGAVPGRPVQWRFQLTSTPGLETACADRIEIGSCSGTLKVRGRGRFRVALTGANVIRPSGAERVGAGGAPRSLASLTSQCEPRERRGGRSAAPDRAKNRATASPIAAACLKPCPEQAETTSPRERRMPVETKRLGRLGRGRSPGARVVGCSPRSRPRTCVSYIAASRTRSRAGRRSRQWSSRASARSRP